MEMDSGPLSPDDQENCIPPEPRQVPIEWSVRALYAAGASMIHDLHEDVGETIIGRLVFPPITDEEYAVALGHMTF